MYSGAAPTSTLDTALPSRKLRSRFPLSCQHPATAMLTRSSSEPLCLALQLYMRLVTRGNPLLQDQHCQVGTDTHAEPLHPCASLNARVLGVLDLRIQVEQVWRRENLANHGPASDIRNPKCDPVLPMDLLRMRLKSKKSCPTFLSPVKTSSLLMGPSPHKPRKCTSMLRLPR